MINMNDERMKKAGWALEQLYLGLAGVYLAFCALQRTTYYLPIPPFFQKALLAAMTAAALLKLPFAGLKKVETWIGPAMGVVYFMIYRADGYAFLPFMAVMTIGCTGIDYRRILKVWLLATGSVLAAAVIAALAGGIDNLVYYRDGFRSSWGICYPTDLASSALFFAILLWAAWDDLPDWAALALGAASAALALFIAQSRNSLICSALFIAVVLYRMIERRYIDREGGPKWIMRGCDGLLTAAFGLFAAVSIFMVWLYSRETAAGYRLNEFMSNRLAHSWKAYSEYGLTAFGTPLNQIGNGFSVIPQAGENFIDSSYVLMLLRYGGVYLLAMCVLWTWTTVKAIRGGNRKLALAMGVIAFHSVMEHHFTEVNYNILAVMPLAVYAAQAGAERKKRCAASGKAWARRIRATVSAVLAAALTAAAWLCLPAALTWLRTVFGALGWHGGDWSGALVLLASLLTAATLLVGLWALHGILSALLTLRRPARRALAVLAACALLAGGGWLLGEGVIRGTSEREAAVLEAEAPAIERIVNAATGRVYANELPEVYMRRFGGISPTALAGDDLARNAGTTAILDAGAEHYTFFRSGFKYAQISPARAVYTDDAAVAEALAADGFEVTDYYSTATEIDLEQEAALNDLPLDERGLALDGPERSLVFGPYADLFGGQYEAVCTLVLAEDADGSGAAEAGNLPEAAVCRLRVSMDWGQTVLAEMDVTRGQFDENGELTAAVPFAAGAGSGLGIQVIASRGQKLFVRDLRYRKVAG